MGFTDCFGLVSIINGNLETCPLLTTIAYSIRGFQTRSRQLKVGKMIDERNDLEKQLTQVHQSFANSITAKERSTRVERYISKSQQLIDENLTFNLVQVITLTTIHLSIILYYNLRIFRGINERQKLLVPLRRKFSHSLKVLEMFIVL